MKKVLGFLISAMSMMIFSSTVSAQIVIPPSSSCIGTPGISPVICSLFETTDESPASETSSVILADNNFWITRLVAIYEDNTYTTISDFVSFSGNTATLISDDAANFNEYLLRFTPPTLSRLIIVPNRFFEDLNGNATFTAKYDCDGECEGEYPGYATINVHSGLDGTVPEPATLGLLGIGLLGFVASRRKSEKNKNA